MDELVTFLRAALDCDGQVARDGEHYWHGIRIESATEAEEEHVRRWDPARVLAEVRAKRAILDLHAPIHGYDPNGPVCSTCGETGNPGDETAVVRWPCPTMLALVQPYAGQPGWRDEWQLSEPA